MDVSIRRHRYRKDLIPIDARLKRYRGAGPGGDLGKLNVAWREVAGAPAAANTVVVRVSRAGVVSVACASAMWAQELNAGRDVLADRLARAVPDVQVTGLRFVIGDHAIPVPEEEARERRTVHPTEDELTRGAEAVGEVSDPVLRDLLARAAAGQLALEREKSKSLQIGKKSGRVGRGG